VGHRFKLLGVIYGFQILKTGQHGLRYFVVKSYNEIKFFLFTNSYSGGRISIYLKEGFKGKKLIKAIKKLSAILNIKYRQTANFITSGVKPTCPYQRLPGSLKIYLEVESELAKLSEEKLDKYSTALEDYRRKLLYPAIERACGNLLEDVGNDYIFQKLLEEKSKSAVHIYYKVVSKYGLPTIRNIPFVLRNIS
jgi:hypothetical protein